MLSGTRELASIIVGRNVYGMVKLYQLDRTLSSRDVYRASDVFPCSSCNHKYAGIAMSLFLSNGLNCYGKKDYWASLLFATLTKMTLNYL